MRLGDVMAEIAEALKTIDGLRVHSFPADKIDPPAAMVEYPERIVFDAAFQRGLDTMTCGITVAVARVWDKATWGLLTPYCDGDSPKSVKAALHRWTFESCSFALVKDAQFATRPIAGVDYAAAFFTVDVAGRGASS